MEMKRVVLLLFDDVFDVDWSASEPVFPSRIRIPIQGIYNNRRYLLLPKVVRSSWSCPLALSVGCLRVVRCLAGYGGVVV